MLEGTNARRERLLMQASFHYTDAFKNCTLRMFNLGPEMHILRPRERPPAI